MKCIDKLRNEASLEEKGAAAEMSTSTNINAQRHFSMHTEIIHNTPLCDVA